MARGLTAVHDRANYVNLGLVELVEGGKDLVALGEVLTDNVDGAVGNRGDLGGIDKGAHGRRIENDVLVLLLQRGNQLGKAARGDNVSRVGNARLGIKEEEVVEGMETEAEEEEADGEEEPEYDEHVWLSLKNTKTLCSAIASNLEAIDPDHADIYKTNVSDYIDALTDLDQQYQTAVNDSKQKTLLFGDRFPFRYMVDDYGLNYYAAFVGCSAETEASFETITFLAQKVDELDLKYVMTIEKSDQKIANTIIQNTKDKNQQILTLDSMQSTTSDDVANGTTYLSVMQNNLTVLKQALQ